MPYDDSKIFDISKPHKVAPNASSRPVIVGHHPILPDPMVLEERYRHPKPLHPQPVEQEKTQEPVLVDQNTPQQESINPPSETQVSATSQMEGDYMTHGAPKQSPEQLPSQPVEKSPAESSQMSSVAPIFDRDASSDGINQTSPIMPQQPLPENPLHLPAEAVSKHHTRNQIWLVITLLIVIAIMAFLAINFLSK